MARPRRSFINVPEFDEVMQDNCPMDKVILYFKESSNEGYYREQVMKKHLRTDEHRKMLADLDLTIDDCLNGRYGVIEEKRVEAMYDDWNKKLGYRAFGF